MIRRLVPFRIPGMPALDGALRKSCVEFIRTIIWTDHFADVV